MIADHTLPERDRQIKLMGFFADSPNFDWKTTNNGI